MDEEKNHPHHRLNPDQTRSPEAKHQPISDVDAWSVIKFGLGLVFACLLVYLSMSYLWNYFNDREARSETPPSPLISSDTLRLPPEPRLQLSPGHKIHPLEELKQLRASEDVLLNSYGWVDQEAGTVRIPIDLAKQLILEKGLPSSPAEISDLGHPRVSGSERTRERR